MVKCAVLKCKHDSRKHNRKKNNISFHRFPKNRDLANKWVAAIKRHNWEPNIRSFVCSVHFSASNIYETKSGRRNLVDDAIPELKLEDDEESVMLLSGVEKNMESTSSIPTSSNLSESQTQKPSTSETIVLPVPEKNVTEPPVDCDTPRKRKLKSELVRLREIAKQRRLRCNSLYSQRNRLKKKVKSLTEMLTQLREKQMITQEHSDILEICSARLSLIYTNFAK